MPTINLAYVAELILKYARKYLYALQLVFFLILISTMFASFAAAFIIFYNLIQHVIDFITNPSTGTILDKVFGLLNCMGIIPAFNDNKAMLISSILFLVFRVLFRQAIRTYVLVINSLKPLVK